MLKIGFNINLKNNKKQQGLESLIKSKFVKGIGAKTAEKIVANAAELFSEKNTEIKIEEIAEKIGVDKEKISALKTKWDSSASYNKSLIPLLDLGISINFAKKLIASYGDSAIEVIKQNPYILTRDIWGVGFIKADEIATKIGFNLQSNFRIQSAIIFFLRSLLESGGVYAPEHDLVRQVITLLKFEEEDFYTDLILKNIKVLIAESKKISLIVSNKINFYTLTIAFSAELEIANFCKKMFATEQVSEKSLGEIFREIEIRSSKEKIALSKEQKEAICKAFFNKISIITGGPGTGKTTLLKNLINLLDSQKIDFLLAAPTGRAAKRMQQSTGRFAQTIHRMLEFDGLKKQFKKNNQNQLLASFVIIDESSMIDLFLCAGLLRAIDPTKTKILFIGDIDQLPSVGAGKILADLIGSKKIAVSRLTQVFRQEKSSLITENAHRVNSGKFLIQAGEGFKRDFIFKKMDNPEGLEEFLKKVFIEILPKYKIAKQNCVILTPMHKGIVGSISINKFLQSFLNNSEQKIQSGMNLFLQGDPVIQQRNNYSKGVFNGDLGRITAIKNEAPNQAEIEVEFGEGEKIVSYNAKELSEISLAYAMSVHKSQGSEFSSVVIPLFTQHFLMLNKNLLYTAISRAKELCVVAGQIKALAIGVKKCQPDTRVTFLKQFLEA